MMKKKNLRVVVVLLLFAMIFTPVCKVETQAATKTEQKTAKSTKVKKPGQVKGLKKVKGGFKCKWDGHRNICTAKISFKKVKGATGYQVLVYHKGGIKGGLTSLLYAKNTKKTTYTIKNLVPNHSYTIKVRAYVKDKKGKITYYGKFKSLKVKTTGNMSGCYYACNSCGAAMPGNAYRIEEHGKATYTVLKEIHAGGTYYWK